MATTNETVVALVEVVVVVVKVAHWYKTLAVVLVNLAVDAVGLDARDMRLVHIANSFGHKLHSLILYRVALGIGSYLLHFRRVLAQLLVVLLVGRASTLLVASDKTMHHSVGITSDWRSEVGVVVECQAEVSDVVDGVFRLHHGSERNSLNEVLLALALAVGHKVVERTGESALCAVGLHLVAKLHNKLSECLELCRVGIVVHTIGQGLWLLALCHLTYRFSHCLVGKKHEFLNELVGILRTLEVAAYRFALLVDIKVQFLAVELYRAVLEACGAKLLGKSVELNQVVGVLALISLLWSFRCRFALAVNNTVVLKQLLHFLVGVAAVDLMTVCTMR